MILELWFDLEKETRNTFRYKERTEPMQRPIMGNIYLVKSAAAALGNPPGIYLEVRAGK